MFDIIAESISWLIGSINRKITGNYFDYWLILKYTTLHEPILSKLMKKKSDMQIAALKNIKCTIWATFIWSALSAGKISS